MRAAILALLITTSFMTPAVAGTWYVAPPSLGGNDANNGESTLTPFATITKGLTKLTTGGDVLYVRGGTYNEFVEILSKHGSSDTVPIRIMDYNDETPVIDVAGVTGTGAAVIIGDSSYIRFDGFTVRNSPEAGIRIRDSHHIRVRWNTVENSQKFGIVAATASASSFGTTNNIVIQSNTVRRNVLNNSGRNISNWTQAIGTLRVNDVDITDNYGVNIYLDNTTDAVVDRNFCMAGRVQNASSYTRDGFGASGIRVANEEHLINGVEVQNPVNNLTITNNITVNGKFGFTYSLSDNGGGLHNTLIANNTFYGAEDLLLYIQNEDNQDVHDSTTIRNNIFYARSGEDYAYAPGSNITYGYNCWYNGNSGTQKSGGGDVLGNPLLVNPGSGTKTDYKIASSSSPCVNTGTYHSAVTEDYWGTGRDSMHDIGAHEFVP